MVRSQRAAVSIDAAAPIDGEGGSVSSWLITGAFVMILGVGIAVDLTGQVHAQTRAIDVANEAARAGAQELDRDAAVIGSGETTLDTAAAARAATAYVAATGLTLTSVQVRGDIVAVRVDTQYETKFLSIMGLTRFPAGGEGEARAVRVVDGVEQ